MRSHWMNTTYKLITTTAKSTAKRNTTLNMPLEHMSTASSDISDKSEESGRMEHIRRRRVDRVGGGEVEQEAEPKAHTPGKVVSDRLCDGEGMVLKKESKISKTGIESEPSSLGSDGTCVSSISEEVGRRRCWLSNRTCTSIE